MNSFNQTYTIIGDLDWIKGVFYIKGSEGYGKDCPEM